MSYRNGRKVIIIKGLFEGKRATVITHIKRKGYIVYELKVEGHRYPFLTRSSNIIAVKK